MTLRVDTRETEADRLYLSGENKAPREFIRNWDLGIYMMIAGIPVLTKDNLPDFITRVRMSQAMVGEPVWSTDPSVFELFIGARANVPALTDAAFFQGLKRNYRGNTDSLRRQWKNRKPGTLSTVLGKDDVR